MSSANRSWRAAVSPSAPAAYTALIRATLGCSAIVFSSSLPAGESRPQGQDDTSHPAAIIRLPCGRLRIGTRRAGHLDQHHPVRSRGSGAAKDIAATPCADWDARGLVNDLVPGNLWTAEPAANGTIEGVGSRLDGDLLGDDPAAAYGIGVGGRGGVPRPGALDAPCGVIRTRARLGLCRAPFPGRASPCWDLAVATGQDHALEPELMEACQQIIEPQLDAFRSADALAPEVAVPANARAQTRFIAMLGRTG